MEMYLIIALILISFTLAVMLIKLENKVNRIDMDVEQLYEEQKDVIYIKIEE